MKIIKAIYFIWVFINFYCLLEGIDKRQGHLFSYKTERVVTVQIEQGEAEEDFFEVQTKEKETIEKTVIDYIVPSEDFKIPFDYNKMYDLTEFFVYVGTPALLYFLIGYVRK